MNFIHDIDKVIEFITKAHEGQKRKYTFEDYVEHPMEVARIVRDTVGLDYDMIAAAMMHDILEDTDHSLTEVEAVGGLTAAVFVEWLTNKEYPEAKNRAERKALIAAHLAEAPAEVKTIKLADIYHNTPTIIKYDPKFAKVYIAENRLLLEALDGGNKKLFKKVEDLLYSVYV
jgi:(p)ppGpp synthase/HD superfamily hydrolase